MDSLGVNYFIFSLPNPSSDFCSARLFLQTSGPNIFLIFPQILAADAAAADDVTCRTRLQNTEPLLCRTPPSPTVLLLSPGRVSRSALSGLGPAGRLFAGCSLAARRGPSISPPLSQPVCLFVPGQLRPELRLFQQPRCCQGARRPWQRRFVWLLDGTLCRQS